MLDRDEDMLTTGTRHPYLGRYKVFLYLLYYLVYRLHFRLVSKVMEDY